ncbi:MAG: transcription elongation factor GreA [Candidatus Nanopelagicales bacterium]
MSEHVTWLTPETHNRLVEELNERQGPIREAIKQKIAEAKAEGDLKENGGYHAAREEQGKNEGRIEHLKYLLENSMVGAPDSPDGEAHIGRIVTIDFGDNDTETYFLASAEEKESKYEVLSYSSPLGEALIGKRIGDEVEYTLPNGKIARVMLVDVQNS